VRAQLILPDGVAQFKAAKITDARYQIGTQLMLAGKMKVSSGYRTAYEIFEPLEFFKELAKRGIMVHEEVYERSQIVT
jgi:hypothetical protein